MLSLFGLESRGDEMTYILSAGEKKRVCYAGVMATTPSILVLDEPGANLDPAGMEDLVKLIQRLSSEEKLTVIFSTHNMELASQLAHKVVVLNKGMLTSFGSAPDVLSDETALRHAGLRCPLPVTFSTMMKKAGMDVGNAITMTDLEKKLRTLGPNTDGGK